MINLLIWVVFGSILGWVIGLAMRNGTEHGTLLNICAGILGALLAGWLSAPVVGNAINHNEFNAPALMIAFFGSITLLSIFNVIRHSSQR
jgi:uncharacterized membrane protein YeaQ/YmgE (transglycosylase-associated protein family)